MVKSLLSGLKGDKGIWLIIFGLTLIGFLAIYSTTSGLANRYRDGDTEYYLVKHVFLVLAGLTLVYVVHKIDYRIYGRLSLVLLGISAVLLAYTLLQGSQINNASRWINLWGYSFQPSDIAKFSVMVFLARFLTEKQDKIKQLYGTFIPVIVVVMVICGLIMPANLSTAFLIFICSIMMLYIAGVRVKYILGLFSIGMFSLVLLFFLVESGVIDKRFGRIETWINRGKDFTNRIFDENYEPNYQTKQANIAIVSGGLLGRGPGKSVQRNYLPHSYSDFVYAIIIEEYGLIGGLLILALYVTLLVRSVAIVTVSKTFGALLAAGLSFLLVSQAMINMGVTVGIFPVTGLPLPLVSMGGTSVLFTCLSLGVILNVSRAAVSNQQTFAHA